jgi:hypothetical protein
MIFYFFIFLLDDLYNINFQSNGEFCEIHDLCTIHSFILDITLNYKQFFSFQIHGINDILIFNIDQIHHLSNKI